MSKRDEIYDAIRAASAAGRTEDVQKLAGYLDSLPANDAPTQFVGPPVPAPEVRHSDFPSALAQSINQGATLGFADEIGAGLSAATKWPFGDKSLGSQYDTALQDERANLSAARRDYPTLFAGGEITGSALPISKIAKLVSALKVPALLKSLGIGATAGGLTGAGSSEGDLTNRAGEAATGAATGAILGPVTELAAKPIINVGGKLTHAVMDRLKATPRSDAEQMLGRALQADLADPEAADRLARIGIGGSKLDLVDVGENTVGLARGAGAKPGQFRSDAAQMLRDRQAGQQDRIVGSMAKEQTNLHANAAPTTEAFKDTFDSFLTSRSSAAKPFYEQAYAAPIDLKTEAFRNVLNRPAMRAALTDARTKLANEGGGSGSGPVRILDAAKRSIDDQISVARRAGQADHARVLTGIKNDLVSEIDRQVPAYSQARSTFAGEAALRDAAETGASLFTPNVSHDEMRRAVADMTAGELQAFRRGALRGLVGKLETTPESRNAAQKLVETTAMRDKLKLLFPNDASVARFMQTASDEAQMSYTKNKVLGGSPTARIQQETGALSTAGEVLHDVATGNKLGLFSKFIRSLGYGEVSPETMTELSDLLLNPQSKSTIRRLANMATTAPPAQISPNTWRTAGGVAGGASALAQTLQRPPPQASQDDPARRLAQTLR